MRVARLGSQDMPSAQSTLTAFSRNSKHREEPQADAEDEISGKAEDAVDAVDIQAAANGHDQEDDTKASLFSPYESSAPEHQPYTTYDAYVTQPTYSTDEQNSQPEGTGAANGYDNYAPGYEQPVAEDIQQNYTSQSGSVYDSQYPSYDQTESGYNATHQQPNHNASVFQDAEIPSAQGYVPQGSYGYAGGYDNFNGQSRQDPYYSQPYDQTQSQYMPPSTNGDVYDPYSNTRSEPQEYYSGYAPKDAGQAPQTVYDPYAAPAAYSGASTNGYVARVAHTDKLPPIPLAVFGLNGRLLTFFPSSESASHPVAPSYGMAYESEGQEGYPVKVRKLADLLPTEEASLSTFPGPLFMDSGSISASGKAKKKKEVLVWLDAMIAEHDKAFGYGATVQDVRRREAEETVILLRLAKVLLEHDGKVTGT
jgi:hypothetical protein